MDFWKSIVFLIRKKSVGPPMIALSIITAGLVYFLLPTVYVSTASMVLTAPATGGTLSQDPTKPGGLTNPLLQFNDGLRTTAGILILAMNAPDVMADLGIVEGGPTRLVVNDGRTNPELLGISTNGPFIYVEAESTSAGAARDATIRAQQRIREELVERQQALRAPRSTFIWMADVVPPSTPEPKLSAKFAAAGGALVVTLLAGFGLAYAVTQIRGGRAAGGTRAESAPVPRADAATDAGSKIDSGIEPGGGAAGGAVPAQAASWAGAPSTDMAAAALGGAGEPGTAEEPGSAREPFGPVTVIRRSEWPEPVSDEPVVAARKRASAADEPGPAKDGVKDVKDAVKDVKDAVKDVAEPVSGDRVPGGSGDPGEWEEETAAWGDDATRELRARLTAERGDVDGRDGSGAAAASPAEDSYVVVVPGTADRDDSRGRA